jgi:hypothetical protein
VEALRTDGMGWIAQALKRAYDGPPAEPKRARRIKVLSHAAMCEMLGQRYHGAPISINATPNGKPKRGPW